MFTSEQTLLHMLNQARITSEQTLLHMLVIWSEIADTHFMFEIPANNLQTLKVGISAMGWPSLL